MRQIRNRSDGRVHFSDLKHMALSPAHYKIACEEPKAPTRPMRVGTACAQVLLGPRHGSNVIRFDGDRRSGKAWDKFAFDNAGAEIITAPEWEEGELAAKAIMADPLAMSLIKPANGSARLEVPLTWDDAGLGCATSGVDIIGDGYLVDVKSTVCTEPEKFKRHASAMFYHAQLVWYAQGARANGIDTSKGLYLIGVETSAPRAVTVFRLTPGMILLGEKLLALWTERLRGCEENDSWPAYAQRVVDFDPPTWLDPTDGEDDGEEVEAA